MHGTGIMTQDNQRLTGSPLRQCNLEGTYQRSTSVQAAAHLGLKGELKELLTAEADILAVDLRMAEVNTMAPAAPRDSKG